VGGLIVDDFDNDGLFDIVTSNWDFCAPMQFFHVGMIRSSGQDARDNAALFRHAHALGGALGFDTALTLVRNGHGNGLRGWRHYRQARNLEPPQFRLFVRAPLNCD
jgi:hypothetical protein